jgi:penicillin V acylase-like amidase (Ntn superfamily)
MLTTAKGKDVKLSEILSEDNLKKFKAEYSELIKNDMLILNTVEGDNEKQINAINSLFSMSSVLGKYKDDKIKIMEAEREIVDTAPPSR